jgi:hypothetical protein
MHAAQTYTPIPDPSVLTTEQMLREVSRAEKLFRAEFEGYEATINALFDAVEVKFDLIERMRVEQKKDTKDAVDAALAAAKEAVKEQTTASGLSITKSETATTEQLKQLSTTFTTANTGLTTLLNDLKSRVDRIENMRQGSKETLSGIYAFAAFLGVIVIILGAVIAFKP